jgi:hypothetical protein
LRARGARFESRIERSRFSGGLDRKEFLNLDARRPLGTVVQVPSQA